MPRPIEFIRMVQRGEFPPPPVAQLVGFTLSEVEPGRAVITFDADGRHANPMGTLHGGILCDISDAAMGMAYAATLDQNETFTTLELKINFLKPVRKGLPTYSGALFDMVANPRSATVMGLLEEARLGRARGMRAAQQAGSVKTWVGRAKDWFLGNF